MRQRPLRRLGVVLLAGLAAASAGCGGGGRTGVVGIGNSANRLVENGTLGEVAEALTRHPSVPPVSDETIVGVFQAIRARAEAGDPEAALIVLLVAEEQRRTKRD